MSAILTVVLNGKLKGLIFLSCHLYLDMKSSGNQCLLSYVCGVTRDVRM